MNPKKPLLHQELTGSIIDCFFVSYNKLDFGYPEHVYVAGLHRELNKAGHRVDREVLTVVNYDEKELARFRIDMLVDDLIVVEIKAGTALPPFAERQVFGYLRSTNLEVGLLLHYGPRPVVKRYIYTNDLKGGIDLRQGTLAPFTDEDEVDPTPEER